MRSPKNCRFQSLQQSLTKFRYKFIGDGSISEGICPIRGSPQEDFRGTEEGRWWCWESGTSEEEWVIHGIPKGHSDPSNVPEVLMSRTQLTEDESMRILLALFSIPPFSPDLWHRQKTLAMLCALEKSWRRIIIKFFTEKVSDLISRFNTGAAYNQSSGNANANKGGEYFIRILKPV